MAEKAKNEKKEGFLKRVAHRFVKGCKDMIGEMKKVVWPSGSTVAKNTATVILCSLAIGACIWIFDGVAGLAIRTLLGAFSG